MQVYLLRHGIAEDEHPGISDADRALTPEGRKRLRHVLNAASGAGLKMDLILSSPLKRAWQTAELARTVLKTEGDIVRSRALMPDVDPAEAWSEVRAHKSLEALLLVGHNPLFSYLASYFLGAESLEVEFKKGAMMRIDFERFTAQPRGTLRWYLTASLAEHYE